MAVLPVQSFIDFASLFDHIIQIIWSCYQQWHQVTRFLNVTQKLHDSWLLNVFAIFVIYFINFRTRKIELLRVKI